MVKNLIDTHAHYNNERYTEDRDALLATLPQHGLSAVVNASYDLPSSHTSVALAAQWPFVYAAVGIHPHDAETVDAAALLQLEKLAKQPKVVAIGEIGLDYFRDLSPRDAQHAAFRAQMELARRCRLPVIIHDRDAHEDTAAIVREFPDLRCVFHCYAGSAEMARQLISAGHMISLTANITYPKPKRAYESALAVGLEHIMVETDCPYMAPQTHRGQRNDSTHVAAVVTQLAQWFDLPVQQVADITSANARRFFHIPEEQKL